MAHDNQTSEPSRFKLYLPLLWTAGVALYMSLKPLLSEETFDATDVAQVIVAVTTAVVVYLARNVDLPGSAKLKTVMTAVGTVAGLLTVSLIGGLDGDEWIDLAVLVAGFAGVSLSKQPQPVPVEGPPNPAVDVEGDPRPPAV